MDSISHQQGEHHYKMERKNIDIGKTKYTSTLRNADDTGRIAFMRQEPSLRECKRKRSKNGKWSN